MLVFDIETDGLLDTLTHVKCLNVIDSDTGKEYRFTDYERYVRLWPDVFGDGELHRLDGGPTKRSGPLRKGLKMLAAAEEIGGQNVIGFDIPAIQKCYPEWKPKGRVRDTQVEAESMYLNLKDTDFKAIRTGRLPESFAQRGLVGRNSLKAWGLRLGGDQQKRDWNPMQYGETWENYSFTEDCDDYCMDDVRTNVVIANHLAKWYEEAPVALTIEHAVARIIRRQERHGWLFDMDRAEKLVSTLQQRAIELAEEGSRVFKPWYTKVKYREGKNHKVQGTTKGADWNQIKWTVFNPTSRDHIADRFIAVYGWQPTEFTDGGKPKIDEEVLGTLPFPEAKPLAELFTVEKRLGQIATGKKAWLKYVGDDGRMHGRVRTNGTITSRMAHFDPNMGQVPANHAPYGVDCRACFTVPRGKKLVGTDADGLELRMLAHYMAKYDGGAYADIVINGDVHWLNAIAIGLVPEGTARDKSNDRLEFLRNIAKRWIYAFLYGAGNFMLGTIVYDSFTDAKKAKFNAAFPGRQRDKALVGLGARSRGRVEKSFPALEKLIKAVKKAAKKGWIRGLDGRRIPVRSEHSALNTLLQSAGAIVMKQALALMWEVYDARWPDGQVEPVGNIHDEVQNECDEEIAHDVGDIAADAIVRAGALLGLRCPLAASSDIGDNWSETH